MGYKYIAEIPLSKIDHIELYINKGKKSISRIKSETGCQYILNGSLFNMKTFKQYCNVKSKGVVQSNPHYNEYGMAWNTNDIVNKRPEKVFVNILQGFSAQSYR